MTGQELALVRRDILDTIGVQVNGCIDNSNTRQGLEMYFEDYTRQGGPKFSIRPRALKWHLVEMSFGTYSRDCLDHIVDHADEEAYLLANSHLDSITKNEGVQVVSMTTLKSETIQSDLSLKYKIPVKGGQHDDECIRHSVRTALVPLMAAIAELIGYTEIEGEREGEMDGSVIYSLVRQRERNPRNRLLCLSYHGNSCHVCDFVSGTKYGSEIGSILEVHHIEPLSELGKARVYDPRKDLIPLCPNCHRAIHKRKPAFTPKELKEILSKND